MEKSWLLEMLSADEVEDEGLDIHWEDVAQPGDEFWSFSSEELSWSCLCGRAGYALVRDGEIIDTFVTVMN